MYTNTFTAAPNLIPTINHPQILTIASLIHVGSTKCVKKSTKPAEPLQHIGKQFPAPRVDFLVSFRLSLLFTDLVDTPPASRTTGSTRGCRQRVQSATWSCPATRSATMPCYRNPWSDMIKLTTMMRWMCVANTTISADRQLLAAPIDPPLPLPLQTSHNFSSKVRDIALPPSASHLSSSTPVKTHGNHHSRDNTPLRPRSPLS